MCVSVNSFMGFYDFIFRLVSSGQMGRKMIFLSIQVYFKYLCIDSSIIFFFFFLYSKMLLAPIFINSYCKAKFNAGNWYTASFWSSLRQAYAAQL